MLIKKLICCLTVSARETEMYLQQTVGVPTAKVTLSIDLNRSEWKLTRQWLQSNLGYYSVVIVEQKLLGAALPLFQTVLIR